jgi:hypothetical protein
MAITLNILQDGSAPVSLSLTDIVQVAMQAHVDTFTVYSASGSPGGAGVASNQYNGSVPAYLADTITKRILAPPLFLYAGETEKLNQLNLISAQVQQVITAAGA